MKRIILASNNKHKIDEISNMLKDINVEVKSLADENINIDIEEDGKTFEENAKKKASEIVKYLNDRGDKDFIVLSDDSGLEVDYLNGEPGIYSARYAGEHGNDKKNNEKLLKELQGVPKEKRDARFVCQLALIDDENNYIPIRGEVRGRILEELNGAGGFGYDPLFFYEPFNKSFGELTQNEKNTVSHRFMALSELKKVIKEIL